MSRKSFKGFVTSWLMRIRCTYANFPASSFTFSANLSFADLGFFCTLVRLTARTRFDFAITLKKMDTLLQTAETINDIIYPIGCAIKLVGTSPTLLIPQTRQWWVRYSSYQISNLGPTATKFLQWASTRRDIFPESFCAHVSKYQSSVPPQALPHFTSTLTKHLPHSVFVQPKACGTGSVAQVYSILLPRAGTYERCAAKVLRPNVRQRIQRDLALMNWIASAVNFLTGDREEWLPIKSG